MPSQTSTATQAQVRAMVGTLAIAAALGILAYAAGLIPGLSTVSSTTVEQRYRACLASCVNTIGICSEKPRTELESCNAQTLNCRVQCDAQLAVDQSNVVVALPTATQGVAYGTALLDPYSENVQMSLQEGSLPAGLAFAQGRLAGIPLTSGDFAFTVRYLYRDSVEARKYILRIDAGTGASGSGTGQTAVAITTASLPTGTMNQAYQFQLEGSGTGSLTWTVSGLPDGIRSDTSGLISGSHAINGSYMIEAVLRDSSGATARREFLLDFLPGSEGQVGTSTGGPSRVTTPVIVPVSILTSTLPLGRVGDAYQLQFQAEGEGLLSWSAPSGLPTGFTLTNTGLLRGTPTSAGTFGITVRATDAKGTLSQRDFMMQISTNQDAPPVVAPFGVVNVGTFPVGTVGQYYNARPFEVTGGKPPYTYSRGSGTLPRGLNLGATGGVVAGIPSVAGTYTFSIDVWDRTYTSIRIPVTIIIQSASAPVSTVPPAPVVIPGPATTQYVEVDAGLAQRLARIRQSGWNVHDLVKLQDDGNADTQYDTTVYYIGADGRRHAFPNPRVYFTWYSGYGLVRIVAPQDMADTPLGANITYRPGSRLVKFLSDPKVYAIDTGRTLRWVRFGTIAEALYGLEWWKRVEDISDAFYGDYRFGTPIETPAQFNAAAAHASARYPSEVLPK